jgi:hypothetical protein
MKLTLENYENFPMLRIPILLINLLQPIPALSVAWIAFFPLDATHTRIRTARGMLSESR